jgi:hypothetical protein
MPTSHGLGFGKGSLIDHGNGVVEYRATGKVIPAFRINVADITGFSVRIPTKADRKNGASRLQQVFVVIGGGTELASVAVNHGTSAAIEAWLRSHPLFRADARQASLTSRPGENTVAIADELTKLAQLRDSGALSPAEFEQAKAKLLR